jgi:hypothetical protein
MKSCKPILIIILFFLVQIQSKAQAYDGAIDRKTIVGYTLVGDKSGMELKYDMGLSDLVSLGVGITHLFFATPTPADTPDKIEYFIEKSDFGAFLSFHLFQKLIHVPKIDIYAGPDLTFKSMAIHAGIKYNFSERFGLYFQASQSFSNSLYGLGGSTDDSSNHFGKKFTIATGLTINMN